MKNINPDKKPELVDLESTLIRRKVSVEEWLAAHDIRSIKQLNENGNSLANEEGYYISETMREKAMEIVKKLSQDDFENLLKISSKPKKKKKTSLNETDSEVDSLGEVETELTDSNKTTE